MGHAASHCAFRSPWRPYMGEWGVNARGNRESDREAFDGCCGCCRASTPVGREDVALPRCFIRNVGKKHDWMDAGEHFLAACGMLLQECTTKVPLGEQRWHACAPSFGSSNVTGQWPARQSAGPFPLMCTFTLPVPTRAQGMQRCTTNHVDAALKANYK